MIVSFYDKNFKGLQNNASLVVANNGYKLIKRPTSMDTFNCICEPFTEDIQPVFMTVKNDVGKYIYGCLAGIPLLNSDNQTEINGTDLKSMLSSDIQITPSSYTTVSAYLTDLFNAWNTQVNQGSFTCELVYEGGADTIAISDLLPATEAQTLDCWTQMLTYLKYYNLYMSTKLDLVNKKVVFTVGKAMIEPIKIKLWEYGIKNYGKWVASVNECQGYYNGTAGTLWILTSDNSITTTASLRDIYPIKRKIINNTESLLKANSEALTTLCDSLYNENVDITPQNINPSFDSKFMLYVKKGGGLYKNLPCGELEYDNNNKLIRVQIGYRITGINFI